MLRTLNCERPQQCRVEEQGQGYGYSEVHDYGFSSSPYGIRKMVYLLLLLSNQHEETAGLLEFWNPGPEIKGHNLYDRAESWGRLISLTKDWTDELCGQERRAISKTPGHKLVR